MRVGLARLLAFLALLEGLISIPLKLSGNELLGVGGGGFLKAASATLLMAIFFVMDDLRDSYRKANST